MKNTTLTLSVFATLRLTRFFTTDTLGGWTVVDKAERWAASHEGAYYAGSGDDDELIYVEPRHHHHVADDELVLIPDRQGWRTKLVSGLSCPHCVGFWIGAATLAAGAMAEQQRWTHALFNGITGSLGLSYITGHISQRLDS